MLWAEEEVAECTELRVHHNEHLFYTVLLPLTLWIICHISQPFWYLLGLGRRSGLVVGAGAWVEGGREVLFGERFSGPTLTDRPPVVVRVCIFCYWWPQYLEDIITNLYTINSSKHCHGKRLPMYRSCLVVKSGEISWLQFTNICQSSTYM